MSNLKVLRTCVILIAAISMSSTTSAVYAAKAPKAKSAAGREGAAANTILSGRGAPKTTLGVDGDFYIDVITYTMYGPKKNDKWPSGVNLKGPQGDAGKAGEKGTVGSAGAASKGDKGERGEKGDKGDKGEAGATGVAGPSGPAGAQGAAGPQGAMGPAGAAGAQGPTGLPGSNGATGPAGAAGAKGDDGSPGAKGDTGDVGPAGPSNVRTGSITFLNSVVGAAGQVLHSETFGALVSSKSYQVEILIYGTGSTDTEIMPLKFEVSGYGDSLVVSDIQWFNSTAQSIRSGSLKFEHRITARFAIMAKDSSLNYSLKATITTGDLIMSGRNISFSGNYLIQEVGSVTN